MSYSIQKKDGDELNRLYESDVPVHEWYRFVLSFPPHLVRHYLEKFSISNHQCVLDPFCGTGTTLVEAKKLGITSVGIEANPVVHFAASVKTDWTVDPAGLVKYAEEIAEEAQKIFDAQGFGGPLFKQSGPDPVQLKGFSEEQERLVIKNSISPIPLHKTLTLLDVMEKRRDQRYDRYGRLAIAKQAVYQISNLRFGPEIGIGKIKHDAPVASLWRKAVLDMAADLERVQHCVAVPSNVYLGDAREPEAVLQPASIDAVITSPPYPNEKDYSRTTRLEAVLLGFLSSRADLRASKKRFVRSNTRSVYKEDTDHLWVASLPRVKELANSIEQCRIDLGKTSGFEKLYGRVVELYFGGMARHLEALQPFLRPGAKLAYVVGDQASYFRILIRTGEILAEIAERLGYEVLNIDLFRTRFSTATKEQLREEVVLLQWNGKA